MSDFRDLLYSTNLSELCRALGYLLDDREVDISPFVDRLHALESVDAHAMFGLTVGHVASLVLALHGYSAAQEVR